jgi:hypothetical protein
VASVKITTALYAALAVVGATAVVLVPLIMYRSGSPALPAWRAAVLPGPLSAAHAFLRTQCESCHVSDRGVEAAACLTCHTFALELLAKQNTAFHATIGECAACHVEHKGGDRPTRMDHGALVVAGAARRPDPAARGSLAALERVLDEAGTALGPPGAALPPKQAERLDCAACHGAQDPHRGRFGTASCQSCHTTENWAVAGWQHPSPRSTDCAQCHQPPRSHDGEHFLGTAQRVATRRPARIEQCDLCHQTNSFSSFRAAAPAEHR